MRRCGAGDVRSSAAAVSRRPLVSVVIPAYRAESFIETAMRSVAAQTHRPLELLVVEDGSPDATAEVAESLARDLGTRDLHVRVLRQPRNLGGAAALRRGFDEARGDLVCWLSADDAFVDTDKTHAQLESLKRGGGLCYCRRSALGPDPVRALPVDHHWFHGLPVADGLFDALPSWRFVALLFNNAINGSSVMLPRGTLAAHGRFDPSTGSIDQDGDLWLRYSALGVRFRSVPSLGAFYRQHSGQLSAQTEAVARGCAVNRLRILLALEDSGRLGWTLRRAWPVLLLVARGGYRLWPSVSRCLVTAGLASDCGPAARAALTLLRARLGHDGLTANAADAELATDARAAMNSEEFRGFRSALAALGATGRGRRRV
jgi:GT2 family glycosyltransferase